MWRKAIIVGVDSDIGAALARHWAKRGREVIGTCLDGRCDIKCDLSDLRSVEQAVERLKKAGAGWEALVVCPGTLEPIGGFAGNDMDEWERSVLINFVRQMRLVHGLLPVRVSATPAPPTVIWLAGGGVNSAPVNYSAYTVSKIALIKMAELLDAEMPEVCFTVVGPGWVKTKIHEQTLRAGEKAGENLERTERMLAGGEMTPMSRVLDCIDWAIAAPKSAVGGRNISVAHDRWESAGLAEALAGDSDRYKLRRFRN